MAPSLPARSRGTPLPVLERTLLKRTVSRCPVCHGDCPAEVWKVSSGQKGRVLLRRTCPEHGMAEAVISSDARFYWLAQGNPENACCGGVACSAQEGGVTGTLGRNAEAAPGSTMEQLSTCLALIEIVYSCNLACPTCFADSPQASHVDAVPLAELQERIQGVIDRKGRIEILQLSGGEPTLHPEFFALLRWLHAHPDIDYILLNTNGVRLATDAAFLEELGRTIRRGRFQLYLQFDGPQEEGQRALRGADLRGLRRRVLERCEVIGIPVTLAMTVTRENLAHLWETVTFGLEFANVRGVAFQPEFTSGRTARAGEARPTGLNTADIILGLVEQGAGRVSFEDFTPLPCGDPNCATIGYLLKTPEGGTRSISEFIDFAQVQGFLRDKMRYRLEDLLQCGCESEPLGELLKQFELDESHTFRLFIKPFMDSWSWDQDRIDRCCTHVIRPDGALDSFCRYYAARNADQIA